MSSETTVGREPVQILEVKQPMCGNVYGVSPCTASLATGLECYNTRPTCQDIDNYRHDPEFLLTPDVIKVDGNTVTNAEILRGDDLFAAVDVFITDTPTGVIWEQGDSTTGSYLGFTSGLLTWRTGDSTSLGGTSTTSKITADVSEFQNKNATILVEYIDSTSVINLWIWDEINRVVTFLGTDTPTTGYSNWASTSAGAVGEVNGTTAVGEDSTDYDGDINELRIYNNLNAPNLVNPFVIPLFFSGGHVGDQKVEGADYIIPSLKSAGTQPTRINLSASNINATGLGNRAIMSTTFADHPHTDRIVDPYVDTRLFDPLDRSSFWSKWFVRNKFRFNILGIIHEGYTGQSISNMRSRSYILTGSSGPTETGDVSIQWKDILARVEERKSQAPIASNGVLTVDIDSVVTSISVVGATTSEYESSGTLRIGDELMTYSGFVESSDIFTFTITERGSDNSTPDEHSADDTVQSCLRFTNQTPNLICETLLVEWGGVSRGFIDKNGTFKSETDDFLSAYILSSVISEPTAVSTLLAELQEQAGFYIWWHERDKLVKMAAVRGVREQPDLFTDSGNIVEKSFSLVDIPRNRMSQVWFSYGLDDPTFPLNSISSFRQTLIQADLPSEGPSQYGERSIRKIFSRWIDSESLALSTASKMITRYSTVPRVCRFKVDAKDRAKWVGDPIQISHFLDVDESGLRKISTWTIISAEEVVPGETVQYEAEDTTLYGKITVIQANGSPDYQGDGTDPFSAAFIGDNNGVLSDETNSARIT